MNTLVVVLVAVALAGCAAGTEPATAPPSTTTADLHSYLSDPARHNMRFSSNMTPFDDPSTSSSSGILWCNATASPQFSAVVNMTVGRLYFSVTGLGGGTYQHVGDWNWTGPQQFVFVPVVKPGYEAYGVALMRERDSASNYAPFQGTFDIGAHC